MGSEFGWFGKFQALKSAKMYKNQNSEPLNVLKWQILHFYNTQNWFHVKSEWQKNHEISALRKFSIHVLSNNQYLWKVKSIFLKGLTWYSVENFEKYMEFTYQNVFLILPICRKFYEFSLACFEIFEMWKHHIFDSSLPVSSQCCQLSVWKFKILRETKFGNFRGSKTATLTICRGSEFSF